MQKAITNNCCSALLKGTGIMVATLLMLPPAFAKDSSTANAVKVDDSSKMMGTQVKSYEEKTNTRRSLRAAANQMQQAAQKDRAQTSSTKSRSTSASASAAATSSATAPTPATVASSTRLKQKSKAILH